VVRNEADLKVSLSVPARAADGASVTETVTVVNLGPATATKVVTELEVVGGHGAKKGLVRIWTRASLAPGASQTLSVTARVGADAHGTAQLAATAVSTTPDPHQSNNVAVAKMILG
jgi:hypothetical protein